MTEFSLRREISRKLFHLLILIFPISLYFFSKYKTFLFIAPLTLIVVGLDYLRRKNATIKNIFEKIFGRILRNHELNNNLCGASWYLMSAFIIFAICNDEITFAAFSILAISDAFASIIGKSFNSKPFFEKSFAGSLAFYLSGLIVLFVTGGIFDSSLWFYVFGFFALFCATVVEARPSLFGVDDNFSVPIAFAFIMTAFHWIWNY